MYRTTAYVGHFLARFERDIKLYMACAALIGFSAFSIYSVLFNLYLLRMDYDVGLIGHFNAAGLLSFALFSPIAGNWARKTGYRRTLVGGMSLMVMGYLLAVPISVFAGANKTAVATRTDTPPVVDGHLSDRCWDLAVPTTDFVLLDPVEGAPATNQTVVKILYTEDQLYIGLFMADSNAENIDARVVPRDGRFAPRDLIGILLDTQHDHRNAYGFYINPYGIQHDFQMTDDGAQGYRRQQQGLGRSLAGRGCGFRQWLVRRSGHRLLHAWPLQPGTTWYGGLTWSVYPSREGSAVTGPLSIRRTAPF